MSENKFNQGFPQSMPMGQPVMSTNGVHAMMPMNPVMQHQTMMVTGSQMHFSMQGMRMGPPNVPPPSYRASMMSPNAGVNSTQQRTSLSKTKGTNQTEKERYIQEQRNKMKQFGRPGAAAVDERQLIGSMFLSESTSSNKPKAKDLNNQEAEDDGFGEFLSVSSVPTEPEPVNETQTDESPNVSTQPEPQKKDLTSMMLEMSDLSGPQKAKGFHKPSLNEVVTNKPHKSRQVKPHQSDHSRKWQQHSQELEGLFSVPDKPQPPPQQQEFTVKQVVCVHPDAAMMQSGVYQQAGQFYSSGSVPPPPPTYTESANSPTIASAAVLNQDANSYTYANNVANPSSVGNLPASSFIPPGQNPTLFVANQVGSFAPPHVVDSQGTTSQAPEMIPINPSSNSLPPPAWFNCSHDQMPPLYMQIWEASLLDNKISTERLYPILLLSGLPREKLAQLWSLCNTLTPGQLVKHELWLLLALIALTQNNQDTRSLNILSSCPVPPIPIFQNQEMPKSAVGHQTRASPHSNVERKVTDDEDDFADFQTAPVSTQTPDRSSLTKPRGHTSPSYEDDELTDGRDSLSQVSTSEQSESEDIKNFETYVEEFNRNQSVSTGSPIHCPFPTLATNNPEHIPKIKMNIHGPGRNHAPTNTPQIPIPTSSSNVTIAESPEFDDFKSAPLSSSQMSVDQGHVRNSAIPHTVPENDKYNALRAGFDEKDLLHEPSLFDAPPVTTNTDNLDPEEDKDWADFSEAPVPTTNESPEKPKENDTLQSASTSISTKHDILKLFNSPQKDVNVDLDAKNQDKNEISSKNFSYFDQEIQQETNSHDLPPFTSSGDSISKLQNLPDNDPDNDWSDFGSSENKLNWPSVSGEDNSQEESDWAEFNTADKINKPEPDANVVTVKKQNLGSNEIMNLFKVRDDPVILSSYQLPTQPSSSHSKSKANREGRRISSADSDMAPPPMDYEEEEEEQIYSRGYDLDEYMQPPLPTTTYSVFGSTQTSHVFSSHTKRAKENKEESKQQSTDNPAIRVNDDDNKNIGDDIQCKNDESLPKEEELDNSASDDISPVTHHPVLPQELLATMPELADKYNIEGEAQGSDRYGHEWEKCLVSCCNVITEANTLFNAISSSSVCNEVLKSNQGLDYVENVVEIYRVVCRLLTSMRSSAISTTELEQTLKNIDLAWNNLTAFLVGASLLPDPTTLKFSSWVLKSDSVEAKKAACGICLLNVNQMCKSGLDKLSYGGRQYHATCANFWVNCVDQTLPNLTLPELL